MSGKCSADPDLDGADCHAADQILAIASIVRLVTLQLGGALAAATVCIPRPVELDRQSVSTAAAVESRIAAIGIGPGLDWDSTVVRPLNWVANSSQSDRGARDNLDSMLVQHGVFHRQPAPS